MDINRHKRKVISNIPEIGRFSKNLNEYYELIEILLKLSDSPKEAKIKDEYWMYYSQVVISKYIFNSSTLANIFNGTVLKLKGVGEAKIIDIASIYTLGRAQIENYLMFYYLYIQPKTKSEQEFRFKLFELSGLTRRGKIKANSEKSRLQLNRDKIKIEELLESINKNKYFNSHTLKERKVILKEKPARIYSWNVLMESTKLNNELIKYSWTFYSNYAHSEFWSMLQLRDYYKDFNSMEQARDIALELSIMLTCVIIKDFVKLYKAIEIIFNGLPKHEIDYINFFDKAAKNKNFFNNNIISL